MKNLLFIAADKTILTGGKNNFYYALLGLATKFAHVSVILPTDQKGLSKNLTANISLHPSPFTAKNSPEVWKEKKFIIEKALALNEKTPFRIVASDLRAPLFEQCKAAAAIALNLKIPHVTEFLITPGLPKSANSAEVIQKMLVKDFLQLHAPEIAAFRVNSWAETKAFLHDELHIPMSKIHPLPPYYIHREIFKDNKQSREPFTLLFAGPLENHTGVYQLLEAVKNLKSTFTEIKLYVIGEGSLREGLRAYIKQWALEKNVALLRWPVSLNSLAWQYGRVSGLVMPYFSGLNYRVCLEAMSCKTPVMLAENPANPEFLVGDHNAYFFGPDRESMMKKIKSLFTDHETRAKIAINGYNTAANFEFRTTLSSYAELYWRLAAG